jgi:hypothetical protein
MRVRYPKRVELGACRGSTPSLCVEAGARRVPADVWKPSDSPLEVKELDEGEHKFKVVATDAAGNVDPSPAKDKFKVVD